MVAVPQISKLLKCHEAKNWENTERLSKHRNVLFDTAGLDDLVGLIPSFLMIEILKYLIKSIKKDSLRNFYLQLQLYFCQKTFSKVKKQIQNTARETGFTFLIVFILMHIYRKWVSWNRKLNKQVDKILLCSFCFCIKSEGEIERFLEHGRTFFLFINKDIYKEQNIKIKRC